MEKLKNLANLFMFNKCHIIQGYWADLDTKLNKYCVIK